MHISKGHLDTKFYRTFSSLRKSLQNPFNIILILFGKSGLSSFIYLNLAVFKKIVFIRFVFCSSEQIDHFTKSWDISMFLVMWCFVQILQTHAWKRYFWKVSFKTDQFKNPPSNKGTPLLINVDSIQHYIR